MFNSAIVRDIPENKLAKVAIATGSVFVLLGILVLLVDVIPTRYFELMVVFQLLLIPVAVLLFFFGMLGQYRYVLTACRCPKCAAAIPADLGKCRFCGNLSVRA